MPRVIIRILLLVSLASAAWAQDKGLTIGRKAGGESRVALVIGNGSYKVGRLRNPVNDATDIAKTLEGLGFQVSLETNLSQKQMKRAIDSFGRKIQRGGVGLFYFSGHGMQVKGRNYLLPVNVELESEEEIEYEAVDVGRVLTKMENAHNRLNIVILDACRNNPFARSWRSVYSGLAHMNAPSGTLIAYATAPGSVARDGSGRNSPYTAELCRQMKVPNQKIEDVFKMVRASVEQITHKQQVPWEASSLVGDFYFLRRGKLPGLAPMRIQPQSARVGATGPDMVLVPAGKFWMGCKDCDPDERPYRQVELDAFRIDRHEVTVSDFQACVDAGRCSAPDTGDSCNWGKPGRESHPLNCVSWDLAKRYCAWEKKRLPTEAEWEKAARGTDGRKFPWGNQPGSCKRAILPEGGAGCGQEGTWPVCSKPEGNGPYGICDMAGNVWEWVSDYYRWNYYQSAPAKNPRGPVSGSGHAQRGGGWLKSSPEDLRSSNRENFDSGRYGPVIGFRCASDAGD